MLQIAKQIKSTFSLEGLVISAEILYGSLDERCFALVKARGLSLRTGVQTMLYLTCTTITSVDLAHYGVSRAKDWVSVDCGTMGPWCLTPILTKYISTLAFKSIQITYFLKLLDPWFSIFTCSIERLKGFRMIKFRQDGRRK